MGHKHERQPPVTMRPEVELTVGDRAELEALQIGVGPFNRIVTDSVAFIQSPGWTEKKKDTKHGILWEAKPSERSNKRAIRFTARVPGCNAATLEHLLCDDKTLRDDPDVSNVYKYDRLITENHADKIVAANVFVQRNNYRSPVPLIAPRQFVSYLTLSCLLDPAQQSLLGLHPTSVDNAKGPRTDQLMAFMQCAKDYAGDASELRAGCVRGHNHAYAVLGQEEADGSLQLTLCMDVDPAGNLAASLAEAANDAQLAKMQFMVRWLQERGPETHLCDVYENTRMFPWRNDV